jgi:hypothetical protein
MTHDKELQIKTTEEFEESSDDEHSSRITA